ncbi:MAG: hypothetical protein QOK14_1694 [Frankiaceae bacterium]|nr:hypothetical protein [Frankiaceae bacterium]
MVLAAVLAAGCDSGAEPKPPPPHKAAAIVSIGRPVAPRFVTVLGPGWVEVRATSPAAGGRPAWRVVAMRPPPGRPRDTCVTVGLAAQDLAEADTTCDVSAPGAGAVSFLDVPGIPDRFGRPPTLISGVAPPDVRAVRVEGLGGTHTLPLSAHRAFVAVYAPGARGTVRLVSQVGNRERVRSFKLPAPLRVYASAHHEHRRRGAVFNDEVGEPITQLSYRQVVHKFGPPAVLRREHGLRCAYYEVVGYANDGWQFCFRRDGRMDGAMGNTPPPAR